MANHEVPSLPDAGQIILVSKCDLQDKAQQENVRLATVYLGALAQASHFCPQLLDLKGRLPQLIDLLGRL